MSRVILWRGNHWAFPAERWEKKCRTPKQVKSICFIGPKSKIRNVLRGVLQSGYHMASSTAAPVEIRKKVFTGIERRKLQKDQRTVRREVVLYTKQPPLYHEDQRRGSATHIHVVKDDCNSHTYSHIPHPSHSSSSCCSILPAVCLPLLRLRMIRAAFISFAKYRRENLKYPLIHLLFKVLNLLSKSSLPHLITVFQRSLLLHN